MKLCSRCKEAKEEDCFNWKNRQNGVRHGHCRECQKKYQKAYYWSEAHDHYVAQNVENKRRRRNELKAQIKQYLEQHPCVDCGESDIRVLQFDHVRGVKKDAVTAMIQHCWSMELIQEEIAKCEVRCANCHMRRTWPNRWE